MLRLTSLLSYSGWVFLCGLCLVYVLSPLDLFPDMLPIVGRLDDVLVLLGLYWLWKRSQAQHSRRTGHTREHTDTAQSASTPDAVHEDDPWQVLCLPRGATPGEIDTAYKAMLLKYHPDRVAHLGEELQALAHRKTLTIQHAYTILKARA